VDGHDGADAALADAGWQLAGESVEEVDAVSFQVADDAPLPPQVFGDAEGGVSGIDEADPLAVDDLPPQVVASAVGCIQAEVAACVVGLGQRVDQRAAVAALSGGVGDDALGVESDDERGIHRGVSIPRV